MLRLWHRPVFVPAVSVASRADHAAGDVLHSGLFGQADQVVDGLYVDDATRVGGQHSVQGEAGGVKGAAHVDGGNSVPALHSAVIDARSMQDTRVFLFLPEYRPGQTRRRTSSCGHITYMANMQHPIGLPVSCP